MSDNSDRFYFLKIYVMIVTLNTDKLKEILDLTSRFVSKHSTLPILENVYMKGNIDTLVFKATDMEKYIEIEIPANIESE
jgi:DNA polymerase III sliding clamp (beta) subunit (PCNA family)